MEKPLMEELPIFPHKKRQLFVAKFCWTMCDERVGNIAMVFVSGRSGSSRDTPTISTDLNISQHISIPRPSKYPSINIIN